MTSYCSKVVLRVAEEMKIRMVRQGRESLTNKDSIHHD